MAKKTVTASLNSEELALFTKMSDKYGFLTVKSFIIGTSLLLESGEIDEALNKQMTEIRRKMVQLKKEGNYD